MIYKLIFLAFLMVFIWIQWHHRPFLTSEANQAEFLLLCCLPVVIMAQVLPSSSDNAQIASIIMSVMVLVPIPLISFFVYRTMSRVWNQYNDDHQEVMRDVLEHSAVASNSAGGMMGTTPLTPESGVEMTGFDQYQAPQYTTNTDTNRDTNGDGDGMNGLVPREEGNGDYGKDELSETDIDLEISNMQDMNQTIHDIVDLVYEGDGQETTNVNSNNEEKLY